MNNKDAAKNLKISIILFVVLLLTMLIMYISLNKRIMDAEGRAFEAIHTQAVEIEKLKFKNESSLDN